MAETIINLPINQVTKITSKGIYQLVDPNPTFLEKTLIIVDVTLVDGEITIILPKSSVYTLGQSQQFCFQTIGTTEIELPSFIIMPYVPEEGQEPDRINGKADASIDDFGAKGIWYSIQLITGNRWTATLI